MALCHRSTMLPHINVNQDLIVLNAIGGNVPLSQVRQPSLFLAM